MSDDRRARWRDKLADGAKKYEAVFTAVGSVATGFALIGVAISGYAAVQQSKSAIQEQREKQPIFRVGAVADDSGRPMKIVVTHEGDVRSGPSMRVSRVPLAQPAPRS